MFNEYYYNTNDFGNLKFELMLDSQAIFETNPSTYIWKTKEVNNLGEDFGTDQFYKTYSANIQYIGKDKEPNINMYIRAGLKNDYGCFNLYDKGLSTIKSEVFSLTKEFLTLWFSNKDFLSIIFCSLVFRQYKEYNFISLDLKYILDSLYI